MRTGFDHDLYTRMQSEHIRSRIAVFGGKLYLELGGKLFDDFHASRVLPGFKPDSKVSMLLNLKDQAELVVAINADDIEKSKVRGDLGISYDADVLRLIVTAYDDRGLLPAGPQNRIWYMPFFSTDVWYMRRQIAQMNLLFEPKGEPAKIEKTDIKPANLQKSIKNEPKTPENEPLNETKTGQLTFF